MIVMRVPGDQRPGNSLSTHNPPSNSMVPSYSMDRWLARSSCTPPYASRSLGRGFGHSNFQWSGIDVVHPPEPTSSNDDSIEIKRRD
jgi:hypothetical protein